MDTIRLTVYGKPAPAGSKTPGRTKDGRLFVRDSSGKSGSEWRQQIRQTAGAALDGHPLLDGPLALQLTFHLPRPKSHYRTNGQTRPSAPDWPTTRPDCLKLARAAEDALTGIAWRDDSQIVLHRISKQYGEPARVEIQIDPAE